MTHESPPPDPLTQEAEHRKTIEALKAQAQYYAQLSEQAEAERDALKAENERYHRALADENIAKLQAEATRTSLEGALKAKAEAWLEAVKERAGAGCGCYGKSAMQRRCANELLALLSAWHDAQCESELTSHGYTPCRCHERAGICYCRKNPCICLPVAPPDGGSPQE
jgi:hypothetical protein